MLKKKRFICIENPKLQKIRDNFRQVIRLKIEEVEDQFRQNIKEIRTNEDGRYRDISQEEKKKINELSRKKYDLHEALTKSIVFCCICETSADHRILNPHTQEWICPKCHALIRNLYYELKEHVDKGGSPGDHDLEWYSTFLD